MPWEKQYNEADVLNRAMEAFWTHGFEATSINRLVEATGLNRGSLYNDFTDKRTLFIRALQQYDQQHRQDFLDSVAQDYAPKDAMIVAFRQVISSCRNGSDRRGCLLVNSALELCPHDPEIEKIIKASLQQVEKFFRSMIKAAQKDGSISTDLDATDTAKQLFALFLGLRIITRSYPERSLMNSVLRQAEALLN